MENRNLCDERVDSTQAKHIVADHLRRHPIPYLVIGAGLVGAAYQIYRRQKAVGRHSNGKYDTASGPHKRAEVHAAREVQSTDSPQPKKPQASPQPEPFHTKPTGPAPAHTGNGERQGQEHQKKAWAEKRRQSFVRTRERLEQNRDQLTQKYADAFERAPLRFAFISAVMGGILGVLLPLSLRERNLWRPLGQRVWLQAQHWSAQELQKWDAAIDAHVESSAAD